MLATTAGVRAVEPSDSANRLDHPYRDLVLLEPVGADDAPRLLVIDAIEPAVGTVHLSILQRDRSWSEVRSLDVGFDAPTPGIHPPWLVALGPTTVAMLAVVPTTGATTVVLLRTDGGPGGDELVEVERADVSARITDAGAADVDDDGVPELVLSSAGVPGAGSCASSMLWVMRPGALARPSAYEVPGQVLFGGVIGHWDAGAGDDLLTYAADGCAPRSAVPVFTVTAINLADGAPFITGIPVISGDPRLGAPLRVDLDGEGLDEAVIRGPGGLTVLDPDRDWASTVLTDPDTLPIAVTPDPSGQGATLSWVDFAQDAVAASASLGRGKDGVPTLGPRLGLPASDLEPLRLRWLANQAGTALAFGQPGLAWSGVLGDDGCTDLLLAGARRECDAPALESGAAWLGTRPLATLGEGGGRRLLVAAGMEANEDTGLVAVPSPWATGLTGWWRHGPSAAFALAELRAGDAAYYRTFPEPRSSIERLSSPDVTTVLPGFTGTRLLVSADATIDAQPPAKISPEQVMRGAAGVTRLRTILRIPVPPGLDSGRDGAAVELPLARVTLGNGDPADQWSMRVAPLNDWGEVGPVAVGLVQRDATGPTLVVVEPFTTPVWPLPARLTGSAEPGSTVVVEGVGEAALDRRGGFAFQTTLAPWPQTIRITATDASGNRTVREVSIIGGVDYRRFPWTVILAVAIVGAVGISGFRGGRRRAGPVGLAGAGGTVTLIDEWPMAELEELPPGGGLPPSRP